MVKNDLLSNDEISELRGFLDTVKPPEKPSHYQEDPLADEIGSAGGDDMSAFMGTF